MSDRFMRNVQRQVGVARQVLAETDEDGRTTIDIVHAPGRICRHPHIKIYRNTAVVACRDCLAWLDPVGVLKQYASCERRLEYTRAEHTKLEDSIREMKREEQRLKARIKRAAARLNKEQSK